MPDRRRIVTFDGGGQATVVKDLEDSVSYFSERDSFKVTPGAATPIVADSPHRLGGSERLGERIGNGSISWTAFVKGSTADQALANADSLLALLRDPRSDLFFEWRPEGASFSTYFDVVGSATLTSEYRWIVFASNKMFKVAVEVPVGPVALYDPMDVYEAFDSAADLNDYAFDAGVGTDVTVSAGGLSPANVMTTERRMAHTARGYLVLEAQATARYFPGTTIASFKGGVVLRRSAANNYLDVYVDDNATNSRLRIDKVVAGVRTNLTSTNLAARVAAGVPYWVRGRTEAGGNRVWAEHFTSTPTPMGTPTTTNDVALTAAEQAALPAGTGGLAWIPQQATARVDGFAYEPFTWRNLLLPDNQEMGSTIPGTAPALCDLVVTNTAVAAAWGLFAWSPKSPPTNLVWNGDFEEDADGWSVGLLTNIQPVAGTSIARDTTAARTKFGVGNGLMVTPASAGAGANFILWRRARKGLTYTAQLWASAAASTTSMVLRLGSSAANDFASSAASALTTTPQLYTVTWTPTSAAANIDDVAVTFVTNAATATTCNIDGVVAFEGTVAPTIGRHAEGAGALGLLGHIEAEGADDITGGWSITSDVSSFAIKCLRDASATGAKTYTAGWWVDPALMTADDFSRGEMDVEVYGRFRLDAGNVSPRATLSARPEWGLNFGAERFTAEWGAAGRLLTKPSTSTAYRWSRLGTLTFPVDRARPARWKLWLNCTIGGGSTGSFQLDYLLLAPLRRRVAGATGKANDGSYPDLFASTSETTRIIMSDLRGLVGKPPFALQPAAGAMGGPLIELPPGQVAWWLHLSNLVPDDPTSDTSTEALNYTTTLHLAVRPRAWLVRSG